MLIAKFATKNYNCDTWSVSCNTMVKNIEFEMENPVTWLERKKKSKLLYIYELSLSLSVGTRILLDSTLVPQVTAFSLGW